MTSSITPAQCRAARALLHISTPRLAGLAVLLFGGR